MLYLFKNILEASSKEDLFYNGIQLCWWERKEFLYYIHCAEESKESRETQFTSQHLECADLFLIYFLLFLESILNSPVFGDLTETDL